MIPVDLNLLCHFIEFLVGSLILAQRKFSLHNLTLPRGWLLFLLRHTTVRAASTVSVDVLMESSKQLLRHLLNGWSGSGQCTPNPQFSTCSLFPLSLSTIGRL
jgi:hypothetical protein